MHSVRRVFNEEDQEDEVERILALHRNEERQTSVVTKSRAVSVFSENLSVLEQEIESKMKTDEDDDNFRDISYKEVM